MNKTMRPTKVLDYYDGVLVFTGADDAGRQYVGAIIDTTDGVDRYLVKAAAPARISDLENGRVDLRSLFLENPADHWYLAWDGNAPDQPLELNLQHGALETTDYLPSDGYYPGGYYPGNCHPGHAETAMLPLLPRLIENWFPINELSVEAVREGGAMAGHPPVNQLHVWWARRPLIASRAAVAASMLPTGADRSRFLANIGTTPDVVAARRQMDAIKAEGGWSDITFPNRRAFLHNPDFLVGAADNANLTAPDPVVLDVTAGGGSIPFEAGRLGFRAIANELNPVACFILRATCQWPQQHGGQIKPDANGKPERALLVDYRQCAAALLARVNELLAGVYPDEYAPDCAGGDCPHPQAICVAPGCSHNTDKCSKNMHRAVRAQRYVWAYLWARTADCPNCHLEIPLSPNWRLDNRGTGMRLTPGADAIALDIVHERAACSDCRAARLCHLASLYPDRSASPGTVNHAIATCPACGAPTPKGYLAQQAQAGQMGHRLYCVIYRDSWRDRNKDGSERKRETTCRIFAPPEERHHARNERAERELESLKPQWEADDILPTESVPEGNDQRPHIYGMEQWVKMFNPRQQLAHAYCVQAFRECVDADADAGRLDDCRRAAWGYVALAMDKLFEYNNVMSVWHPNREVLAHAFTTHDFGFKWSYAEMAVTCRGLGLEWTLRDVGDCLSKMIDMTGHPAAGAGDVQDAITPASGAPAAPPAEIIRGDARALPQADGSVDGIVFDPPYEENVNYAELSDFFYVWLKRTAGYHPLFPDDFTDYLTEKDQEAIASPARFKARATKGQTAKTLALADYQDKMAEIFAECRRVIKPDGIMTVMFNHKSTAAWDALTVALIRAGFAVTRTWPVKTEAESSMHIKGRAAARTTILLVCRPRAVNPFPKPWHEVEDLIARAVQDDISDNLAPAGLHPIDLYLSAFGPALRVISAHWGTERESVNTERPSDPFLVTPTDALQVARREVSRHRAREISREWAGSPVDPATKFYILAKDAAANDTLLFDEANLLARAIGVALERNDPALRRVVGFRGDKVSLLTARDRLAAGSIGDDINPDGVLDEVHTAVALADRRNTLDARQWLTHRLIDAQASPFRATLEALIRTTRPGHDDHQSQRNLWQALYAAEPPPPAGVQGALL